MTGQGLIAGQAGTVMHRGHRVPVEVSLRPAGSLSFGRYGGGRVLAVDPLPVGVAMQLEIADGRRCLIVLVDENGTFLAAGPVWNPTD